MVERSEVGKTARLNDTIKSISDRVKSLRLQIRDHYKMLDKLESELRVSLEELVKKERELELCDDELALLKCSICDCWKSRVSET